MKEVNAGKECAASYSCLGGTCWREVELPNGDRIWITQFESCG
jgi:hypothetical protein